MIKNIIFDFDGVIIDSVSLKGEAFYNLFDTYDENLRQAFLDFHKENGGVSRYKKIKYFFKNISKQDYTDDLVIQYANKFSNYIFKKLCDSNRLINEVIIFIKENHQKYNLDIVSASDQNELIKICGFHKLTPFFRNILGSPTQKHINVENLIRANNYNLNETVMIGDSSTDLHAAATNNIYFIGFNNPSLSKTNNYIPKNSFGDLIHQILNSPEKHS